MHSQEAYATQEAWAWRWAADPGRFVARSWPDEDSALVFDRASGDTHLVSSLALDLMERLRTHGQPRTPEALLAELQDELQDDPPGEPLDDQALAVLLQQLRRLERLGVLASIPADASMSARS
ncbi:HPr-rel-A system PqqD family peptide chaperone [Pelomonas sp. CA6]|uniref:HPr-rel-A system PqqD family peptide chaperone n=1 Tax=Pelomonas sp. CA6 TaxID=2907999 RepID=UPI001F4A6958|nr:HPr-rel-A system PqqD family peptide chaperone [Pelomonas sp. CA6]MCH7342517.1 HPr-rel-A system PqqD family peptide chaperone [Pelomonas sp. CA6]